MFHLIAVELRSNKFCLKHVCDLHKVWCRQNRLPVYYYASLFSSQEQTRLLTVTERGVGFIEMETVKNQMVNVYNLLRLVYFMFYCNKISNVLFNCD